MDDEDDDLYDPSDSFPQHHDQNGHGQTDAPGNSLEAEEYNEEEDDDDDDFNIITEAPTDAVPGPAHPRHAALLNESQRSTSADSTAIAKSATPSAPVKFESASPALVQARPVASLKPGSDYPAIHMSTLDVNANPTHPTTGKSILSTDLDSDFPSEDDKPWRRPGQDITDYFNYGFDEFTWASYCLKQQELRKEVTDQKKQLDDMQSFLTMGMPGMPGAPPGGPAPSMPGAAPAGGGAPGGLQGMTGIPDMPPDMMQGMLASMMAQGLDPSSMDPMSFMQHAQAMMGGGQPGGGQQGQGYGGQGGNQQQMGYGGYNQQGGYSGGRGRGGGGRRW